MRRLIEFIVAHSNIFIFLIYAAISFTMLFSFNPYQSSVFFTTANKVVGRYYTYTGHVSRYFGLREINMELQKQNSALKIEVARLNEELNKLKGEVTYHEKYTTDTIVGPVAYGVAQVVNVTTAYAYNYVTINKGKTDGIADGMGVINHDGVVGIVSAVSDNFSVVISLLNPKLRLSCKIKGSEYFGSLTWDGRSPDYMTLEELPRHVAGENRLERHPPGGGLSDPLHLQYPGRGQQGVGNCCPCGGGTKIKCCPSGNGKRKKSQMRIARVVRISRYFWPRTPVHARSGRKNAFQKENA